ncbi:MAG: NAD(+)/NADH kinase [Chloroherpetonaceae bacterium]
MEKVALFENQKKKEAIELAQYVSKEFFQKDLKCYVSFDLYEYFTDEYKKYVTAIAIGDFDKYADAVMTFGGDGTILSAIRYVGRSEIPILGINVGKLGFLAEYSNKMIDQAIDDLIMGNYRVVDRTMLHTKINGESIYALNDFVIEKLSSSRMITLHTYSDEHFVGSYRADGLIINTPTGSTAYSLACGGPIIAPSTRVICITPISPHSLTFRPLVIPDDNQVRIIIESPSDEAKLVADGQIEKILKNNDEVIISLADYRVKLIKPMKNSYYDVLRAKLLWATDPTAVKEEDNKSKSLANRK